jgi:hypothetical protein
MMGSGHRTVLLVTLLLTALAFGARSAPTSYASARHFPPTVKVCSALPGSDISKVLGKDEKPTLVQEADIAGCRINNSQLVVVAEVTMIGYTGEAGVTSTPIFGLPANLLVWSPSALQPALSGRAHVQFVTTLKSYYWELVGNQTVSNAKLETLAGDLYKALGGSVAKASATHDVFASEADSITSLVDNLTGPFEADLDSLAAEECALDTDVAGGGSCSNLGPLESAATSRVGPFVARLQSGQGAVGTDLKTLLQSGQPAATVRHEVAKAAGDLGNLAKLVQSLEPDALDLVPGLEPLSSVNLETTQGAIEGAASAIAQTEQVVQAKGAKLGTNPGAEASTAAGL